MSSPVPITNQPRVGSRMVPMSMMDRLPVLTTPPAVRTPTSCPRPRVLTAWLKISALLKLFWLHSTMIGFDHEAKTLRSCG